MYNIIQLQNLDGYFLAQSSRNNKGVFCYRINIFNDEIGKFIEKYFHETRVNGVCIEGGLQNPTENNLKYYDEIIGINFEMNDTFIDGNISKWLPRLDNNQRKCLVESILFQLQDMKQKGKNENILKNAYIKYMCWLYYKFEQVLSKAGNDNVPKILFEGAVNIHELNILSIVAKCGCDVILLQYESDELYKKHDANDEKSILYSASAGQPFPTDYSINNNIREKIKQQSRQNQSVQNQSVQNNNSTPPVSNNVTNNNKSNNIKRIIGGVMQQNKSVYEKYTNQWLTGHSFEDIKLGCQKRGNKPNYYYNASIKMVGVENKTTYVSELFQLYQNIKSSKRGLVIIEGEMLPPRTDEISKVNLKNYDTYEELMGDMFKNISYPQNIELEKVLKCEFLQLLLDESQNENMTVKRLTNKAVAIICWLNRYKEELFGNWDIYNMPVVIFLNSWKQDNQNLFIKYLTNLPVDTFMLLPDLTQPVEYVAPLVFEQKFSDSLVVDKFPKDETQMVVGTVAYHAEQELNEIMYDGNSGMYRNQQYKKANTVTLQTMYEEISIIWKEEAQFRPNFGTTDDSIIIPVIFSKICGVKDGNTKQYWADVKRLIIGSTYVIKKVPFCYNDEHNPVKPHARRWYQNGKLQREIIINHKDFMYSHLRVEVQQHILDKLELLINRKIIKGTGTGVEYTIVATILALNRDIVRLLQRFDFTKNIPKIVCVDTTESTYSQEDSIILAFLNLVGFDIILFTPTGYQNIEKYFETSIINEHQIGEYMYDMAVPRLESNTSSQSKSWKNKLFGRGN